jgi:vacuolar-type H+-ATPase subunit I/STV1
VEPLTAAVLAAITSFVTAKTQDFLNQAGEVAVAKAKAIFGKLKERWSGDEAARRDLDSFAREPKIYAPVIEARLEQKLAEDSELRAELEQLVSEMGPQIEVVQRIARGEGITGLQADEISRGRVSVQQQVTEGKDVTGASFGKIG